MLDGILVGSMQGKCLILCPPSAQRLRGQPGKAANAKDHLGALLDTLGRELDESTKIRVVGSLTKTTWAVLSNFLTLCKFIQFNYLLILTWGHWGGGVSVLTPGGAQESICGTRDPNPANCKASVIHSVSLFWSGDLAFKQGDIASFLFRFFS